MAPLPKNSVHHFTHPPHPLTAFNADREYLCDGCVTPGNGKRYRCHGCNFHLHEYCATCPQTLSSFLHQNHTLSLVIRKAQGARQVNRVCDVCAEPVEGLFYRCKECDFDVHPLCTQLPEKLQHALHKIHPLNLKSSKIAGICAVCRNLIKGWRYGCGICNFDIHLDCVLVPVVACPQNAQNNQRGIPVFDQGIPFQPPPQFANYYYGFPHAPGYHCGPGFNPQYNPYMYQNNFAPQNQVGATNNGAGGGFRKSMFALVGQLGFGVLSNMIFGVDLSSVFTG